MQESPFLVSRKAFKFEFQAYHVIKINSENYYIGRGRENTLTIPSKRLEIIHCKLLKTENQWILEDYSAFGIKINGLKIGKGNRRHINCEDVITLDQFSEFVYKFVYADVAIAPTDAKGIKPGTGSTPNFDEKEFALNIIEEIFVILSPAWRYQFIRLFRLLFNSSDELKEKLLTLSRLDERIQELGGLDQRVNELSENIAIEKWIQDIDRKHGHVQFALDFVKATYSKELADVHAKRSQIAIDNAKATTINKLNEIGDLMESELQCSVCTQLFMGPTILNCSHTFCLYCISVWRKTKDECPMCRARITSTGKNLVLESFIEKLVNKLSDDTKQKRKNMLQSRKDEMKSMDLWMRTAEPSTSRN